MRGPAGIHSPSGERQIDTELAAAVVSAKDQSENEADSSAEGDESSRDSDDSSSSSSNSDSDVSSSDSGADSSPGDSDEEDAPKETRAAPPRPPRETPSKDFGKFASSAVWGMMERMGYKHGEGLGLHGEGRVEPVQVRLRRAGEGISFSGSEKPPEPQKRPERKTRQQGKSGYLSNSPSASASPRAPRMPPRQRTEYKTLEELQRRTEIKMRDVFVDMTTNTEVGSFSELAAKQLSAGEKEQLASDVRLGLDLAFSKQENLRRERSVEEARLAALTREMQSLSTSIERREARIEHLQAIKTVVGDVQRAAKDALVGSAETAVSDTSELYAQYANLFQAAKRVEAKGGFDVWTELSLEKVITGSLYEHLLRAFRTWDPVAHPRLLAELVAPLLKYVSINDGTAIAEEMTPFESLLNRTAVPRLKQFLYSLWDPLTDDLAALLSSLPPVITAAVSDDISDVLQRFVNNINPRLVMEKYKRASIERLKPASTLLSDLRVEGALLPWLPFIDQRGELLATIRRKLCVALDYWMPTKENNSDMVALVSPWMDVFEDKELRRLSAKVVDRLEGMLRSEFRFDAQRQVIWPFKVLLAWHGVLPFGTWFSLVQRQVISGFLNYLRVWLSDPNANYAEIADWYWRWKLLYPADIFREPEVQHEFKKALVYMSYAVSQRASSE
ncbi:hypothetical protein GQ54DRAFT_306219 [Martensiomyces pterosporus]|nr:hypothetical protein GQ54DRAFT_306219 [Martensiomyces pterosporus]